MTRVAFATLQVILAGESNIDALVANSLARNALQVPVAKDVKCWCNVASVLLLARGTC